MKKRKIEAIYPLTSMQTALLIHSLSEEQDQGFIQVECRLTGTLDPEVLNKSWQNCVDKFQALRTTVHWESIEKPVQLVHPSILYEIDYQDLNINPSQTENKVNEIKSQDRSNKLDLTQKPSSRLSIYKLSEDVHYLLWTCHHILLDGWSASLVIKELFSNYKNISEGKPGSQAPTPSYGAYLKAKTKANDELEKNFWINYLKGYNTDSSLVNARGKESSTRNMESVVLQFDEEFLQQAQNTASSFKVSVNSFFQGVWSLIFSKLLNSKDLMFGMTVSGRSNSFPNINSLVGLCTNVLPVRIRMQEESLPELMRSIQSTILSTIKYEDTPLDKILTWLDWRNSNPLFNTLIVTENFPWETIAAGSIKVNEFKSGITTTYPLTITHKFEPGFTVKLIYDQSKIKSETIKYLADSFKATLTRIFEDQSIQLSDLLASFNDHKGDFKIPEGKTNSNHGGNGIFSSREPAQNSLELSLFRIWENVLGHSKFGVTDKFLKIGGSSLLAVRMFGKVQEKLGVNLQPILLLKYPDIRSLAEYIGSDKEEENWSSVIPLQTQGSRQPLFCLHAGGGHVFFYDELAELLDKDQPVYAIEPTALDSGELKETSIEEISETYLEEILRVCPDGKYTVLGYCFSNTVAFEISLQQQKMGLPAPEVIIVDSVPTNINPKEKPKLSQRVDGFKSRFRKSPIKAIQKMIEIRLDRMRKRLDSYYENSRKTRQEKNIQKLEEIFGNLYLQYQWPVYKGKLILIRSTESVNGKFNEIQLKTMNKLVDGTLDIHVVEGHHRTLFKQPEVQGLAATLEKILGDVKSEPVLQKDK